MTVLYLHGYNSTHQNARTDWLKQFGKIVNPPMAYRNFPLDYRYLENLVIEHRPDVMVASSMGGYFAFHLGNYYRIPTVLLNPALLVQHIVKPDIRVFATDTIHHIILGQYDEVIPPESTKAILKQTKARYRLYEFDMGHKTPFDIFEEVCRKSGLFK